LADGVSNVLTIDYRGYGLSPGVPTETTCFEDARSAWDYLTGIIRRVKPGETPEEMVGVIGHSLGGSIAADLLMKLGKDGKPYPFNEQRSTEDNRRRDLTEMLRNHGFADHGTGIFRRVSETNMTRHTDVDVVHPTLNLRMSGGNFG